MVKAILEYDLDNPDDEQMFKTAHQGYHLVQAIGDLFDYIRAQVKYGELEDKEENVMIDVRETFYQMLSDRGINIDNLLDH